jgi:pyruvate/2-oxoglutarate dehydrogenase complex dihydrolipoamide acyltransferase (E2) component
MGEPLARGGTPAGVAGRIFVGGNTQEGAKPVLRVGQVVGVGGGDGAVPPACFQEVAFHTQVSEPTEPPEPPEDATAKPEPTAPPKRTTVPDGPAAMAAPLRMLGPFATMS